MILFAAAALVIAFAALAATGRARTGRRSLGWVLLAVSLAAAMAGDGWSGLIAWFGLVPIAAGSVLLHRTYRAR